MLLATAGLDLPVLHWILSPLVAILLLLAMLVYALVGWRVTKRAGNALAELTAGVDALSGYSAANAARLAALAGDTGFEPLRQRIARLQQDALQLHDGKWIPDPAPLLRPERLLTPLESNSLSLRPAVSLLLIGIGGTLASLIAQISLPLPQGPVAVLFTAVPAAVGLAGSLLLAVLAQSRHALLVRHADDLGEAIARRVPALGSQAGLSALVNAFLDADRHTQTALDAFTATTARIAEADMAAGIQHSVERVLMETVAPSIAEATGALGSLARDVASRQEKGMQDLAVRFAAALSDELASHLEPVYERLGQLTPLMGDVKQYVEVALRSLQAARAEADALARHTDASIGILAEAREAFSADSNAMRQEITRLADATASMAGIYSGNEHALADTVHEMNQQMAQYAQRLAGLVAEASRALREAQDASQKQSETAGQYVTDMRAQVGRLTEGLKQEIGLLLDQMRQETGQLTLQSTAINQRFHELNALLDRTGQTFADESNRYVQETLQTFDSGLAEVVSRLASAANEIRDAVDALPQVLRRSAEFK